MEITLTYIAVVLMKTYKEHMNQFIKDLNLYSIDELELICKDFLLNQTLS